MGRLGVALGCMLLVAVGFGPARAGDELPSQLPFVTVDNYPPFADTHLPEGGLAVEMVKAAFVAVGITATVEFSTWEQAYDSMLNASYAGAFPYRRTPEREAAALYSDAIFVLLYQAVSNKERPVRYDGPDSVKGLRMCLPQGWAPAAPLVPLVDSGDLALVTPAEAVACPRLVQAGRADFVVLNNFVADHIVADAGYRLSDFATEQAAIMVATGHLLVSQGIPNGQTVVERFNRGLQLLKEHGDYDRIMAKHLAGGA